MINWHKIYYNEEYVKMRNKCLPKAERVADVAHGCSCTFKAEKDRMTWAAKWTKTFLAEVERLYRLEVNQF